MRNLDQLLTKIDHPPFDRVARLHVDIAGPLDGPATLTLSATTLSGNGKQESAKKAFEVVTLDRREELELRVAWVLRVTQERRLFSPKIDEVYDARPLGYDGPLRLLGAELDCRLDAARALVSPQVLVEIAASIIPPERSWGGACFARARFQGVLVTPHIIEVKLYDSDLAGVDDDRWIMLKTWAQTSAANNSCTVGT